nr:MAG TPA: hypothetical protein [Caudoviricetes sp.]
MIRKEWYAVLSEDEINGDRSWYIDETLNSRDSAMLYRDINTGIDGERRIVVRCTLGMAVFRLLCLVLILISWPVCLYTSIWLYAAQVPPYMSGYALITTDVVSVIVAVLSTIIWHYSTDIYRSIGTRYGWTVDD